MIEESKYEKRDLPSSLSAILIVISIFVMVVSQPQFYSKILSISVLVILIAILVIILSIHFDLSSKIQKSRYEKGLDKKAIFFLNEYKSLIKKFIVNFCDESRQNTIYNLIKKTRAHYGFKDGDMFRTEIKIFKSWIESFKENYFLYKRIYLSKHVNQFANLIRSYHRIVKDFYKIVDEIGVSKLKKNIKEEYDEFRTNYNVFIKDVEKFIEKFNSELKIEPQIHAYFEHAKDLKT